MLKTVTSPFSILWVTPTEALLYGIEGGDFFHIRTPEELRSAFAQAPRHSILVLLDTPLATVQTVAMPPLVGHARRALIQRYLRRKIPPEGSHSLPLERVWAYDISALLADNLPKERPLWTIPIAPKAAPWVHALADSPLALRDILYAPLHLSLALAHPFNLPSDAVVITILGMPDGEVRQSVIFQNLCWLHRRHTPTRPGDVRADLNSTLLYLKNLGLPQGGIYVVVAGTCEFTREAEAILKSIPDLPLYLRTCPPAQPLLNWLVKCLADAPYNSPMNTPILRQARLLHRATWGALLLGATGLALSLGLILSSPPAVFSQTPIENAISREAQLQAEVTAEEARIRALPCPFEETTIDAYTALSAHTFALAPLHAKLLEALPASMRLSGISFHRPLVDAHVNSPSPLEVRLDTYAVDTTIPLEEAQNDFSLLLSRLADAFPDSQVTVELTPGHNAQRDSRPESTSYSSVSEPQMREPALPYAGALTLWIEERGEEEEDA